MGKASVIWSISWIAMVFFVISVILLFVGIIQYKNRSKKQVKIKIRYAVVPLVMCTVVLFAMKYLASKPENMYSIKYDNSAVKQFDRVGYEDFDITVYPFLRMKRKPDNVEISSAVISSKEITITVDKSYKKVIKYKDYLKSKSVDFKYDGKGSIKRDEDIDVKKLKGVITYEDGSKGDVDVKYVKVSHDGDGARVTVSDGINSFTWMPEIEDK